jgi:hypothetical protein
MLGGRLSDNRSRMVFRVLYRGAPQPCLAVLGPFLELTPENGKKRITPVLYFDTPYSGPFNPRRSLPP